eukprot:CAMPEP_0177590622 /NCGR_PEP_ID=MMETSP0419_2-20121207/7518_1 /TAXON_ID=582737 /ORGANISM="Tetraselmis sp., Strain GSL018" /LENGTH=499 /DNA_ID=CAMNT_0019081221 /DNA_START=671 /DNA_END=2167 /DNA_ORIENTATION=-
MDTTAAGSQQWTLRLRGPKGTPSTIDLPEGNKTTATQLADIIAKATRVSAKKLIIRAGFPPKNLQFEASDNTNVVDLGLTNRDLLHVERSSRETALHTATKAATEAGENTADCPKTPSRPAEQTKANSESPEASSSRQLATPETKHQKKPSTSPAPVQTPQQEAPVRTAGAAAGTAVRQPAKPALPAASSRPKAPKRRRLRLEGTGRRLGDTNEGDGQSGASSLALGSTPTVKESVESALAADMVAAASGGGGPVTAAFKSLRRSFREASKARGAEAEARLKVSAATSERVAFRPLGDGTGRLEVEYAIGPRGKARREVVPDIPAVLLPAILNLVASDDDPVSRRNLRVEAMALVSPRMFWAIVRHGRVGRERSFHDALHALVPQIDWEQIEQRERHEPERYADYVKHEAAADVRPSRLPVLGSEGPPPHPSFLPLSSEAAAKPRAHPRETEPKTCGGRAFRDAAAKPCGCAEKPPAPKAKAGWGQAHFAGNDGAPPRR